MYSTYGVRTVNVQCTSAVRALCMHCAYTVRRTLCAQCAHGRRTVYIPLSDIPLSDIPLSDIPLSDITLYILAALC